uniref:Ovule protein n=1 Tax=Rhabditophanes sp. KR3021 TaxID=114890 RepID=A0AC35UC02_9BILA
MVLVYSNDNDIQRKKTDHTFCQTKLLPPHIEYQIVPTRYSFGSTVERTNLSFNEYSDPLNSIFSVTPQNMETIRLDDTDDTYHSLPRESLVNLVSSDYS